MIQEFQDSGTARLHDAFQAWRAKNSSGFFLSFSSRRSATLHGAHCQHVGATDWMIADYGRSLTSARKVVSTSRTELEQWGRSDGISIQFCRHCQRDGLLASTVENTTVEALDATLQQTVLRSLALDPQVNYWVVRGSPAENGDFDFVRAGKAGRWRTKVPPKSWATGDRLFFWASSPRRELIALGEFQGETKLYTDKGELKYNVRYCTGVLARPLAMNELRADPELKNAIFLRSGPAASVVRLTRSEGETCID